MPQYSCYDFNLLIWMFCCAGRGRVYLQAADVLCDSHRRRRCCRRGGAHGTSMAQRVAQLGGPAPKKHGLADEAVRWSPWQGVARREGWAALVALQM